VNHREETTLLCHTTWRKSSRSGGEGQCIETASTLGCIFVRDSKNLSGSALACSHTEWTAFLDAVKNSNLDLC
jgi:hypothetical protein